MIHILFFWPIGNTPGKIFLISVEYIRGMAHTWMDGSASLPW